MRALLASIAAVSLLAGTCTTVLAAEDNLTPQQEGKACNAQAGDKKSDERRAFMSQSLKGGATMPMTQQDRMKKCNADASAKALKGDERQAFMSTYLKVDKKS